MLILLKFLEFRQVFRHFRIRKTFTIAAVISHRKRNEVIPYNAYDIQVVMDIGQRLIVKEFMGRVSHRVSGIRLLSPVK